MADIKIIGIGGTNGSGKDSLGQFLADDHGWLFISVTEILRDELKRRGLPIERNNLRNLSAEWRRESGLGVLVDKAVEIYKNSDKKYNGLAIASFRNPGEVDRTHALGGKVVWADADPKVRYERINGRGRGAEDNKTYEQFLEEEQAEMQHSGDEATLNMSGVKAKADIYLENNANNLEYFKKEAQEALKGYL